DASLSVDGEMAFRVTCPPDNETVRPIDCVVMMKEGRMFMLIGGARETGELNAAIDEIAASWKWKN
ncbi:MAG: hypothetical protein U1E05_23465, partial [Patescibacteria group bacterium]|nr:hypothetical protein [Patescibacteria group bacterium]